MKAKETLQYRSIWMGLAMLWVMWYHLDQHLPQALRCAPASVGFGGVDICIFASGIGCWFSLERDRDVFAFYKRRFFRLMPTYLCFIPLWLAFRGMTQGMPLRAVWGNLLGIQSFANPSLGFNWYIAAILHFYILAPLFKGVADSGHRVRFHIAVVLLLCSVSLPFQPIDVSVGVISRLPLFYMGMVYAKYCESGGRIDRKLALGLTGAFLAGLALLGCAAMRLRHLVAYGVLWYPFALIVPGLCIGISGAMRFLDGKGWLRRTGKLAERMGTLSFELYLSHLLCFEAAAYLLEKAGLTNRVWPWGIAVLLAFAGAVLLEKLVSALKRRCRKKEKKNTGE